MDPIMQAAFNRSVEIMEEPDAPPHATETGDGPPQTEGGDEIKGDDDVPEEVPEEAQDDDVPEDVAEELTDETVDEAPTDGLSDHAGADASDAGNVDDASLPPASGDDGAPSTPPTPSDQAAPDLD